MVNLSKSCMPTFNTSHLYSLRSVPFTCLALHTPSAPYYILIYSWPLALMTYKQRDFWGCMKHFRIHVLGTILSWLIIPFWSELAAPPTQDWRRYICNFNFILRGATIISEAGVSTDLLCKLHSPVRLGEKLRKLGFRPTMLIVTWWNVKTVPRMTWILWSREANFYRVLESW